MCLIKKKNLKLPKNHNSKDTNFPTHLQEKIYDVEELKKDFSNFLDVCSGLLSTWKPLRTCYLVNGEPILYLAEIPRESSVILVGNKTSRGSDLNAYNLYINELIAITLLTLKFSHRYSIFLPSKSKIF